jgi:hypothetical protein
LLSCLFLFYLAGFFIFGTVFANICIGNVAH